MRHRNLALGITALLAVWLFAPADGQAGWLERWHTSRVRYDSELNPAAMQPSPSQPTALQPAAPPGPGAFAPPSAASAAMQPPPSSGPRTPPAGALSVGPEAVTEPLPEPFSARGGAVGVGPGTSGVVGPSAATSAARGPAASPPHHVVVEVPSGVCTKKPVLVHCRGCAPGCCIKTWGQLPCCVTCQPRTFRVKNPLNQCPVDVTVCMPDAPEKARKVERDPYYITYHFTDCRITIWFLFERNNDYMVEYAAERPI